MNVNRNIQDPFYRYKMPKINSRQAGQGNGCYTFLDNISDVSNSINTPNQILFSYITNSLGTSYNEKKQTITGHYTDEEITNCIYDYIDSFVLCKKCTIPEIIINIEGTKKKKKINCKCSACGVEYKLDSNKKTDSKVIEQIIKYYSTNEFISNKELKEVKTGIEQISLFS